MTFVLIFRQSSPAEAGPQNQLERRKTRWRVKKRMRLETETKKRMEMSSMERTSLEMPSLDSTQDVSSVVGSQETDMVSL